MTEHPPDEAPAAAPHEYPHDRGDVTIESLTADVRENPHAYPPIFDDNLRTYGVDVQRPTSQPVTQRMSHNSSTEVFGGLIDRERQLHDLTVDTQDFGTVAVASEVAAGLDIHGKAPDLHFNSPLKRRDLRRQLMIDVESAKTLFQVPERKAEVQTTYDRMNEDLAAIKSSPEATTNYLRQKVDELRKSHRVHHSENFNMVMDGAEIAPFLVQLKDSRAAERGVPSERYSWTNWFGDATDEQLTNFSQWYSDKLQVLSNPSSREKYIDTLKEQYMSKVDGAVEAGWLSQDFKSRANKRVAKANVHFFSIFGNYIYEFGGATQEHPRGRDKVALPTISSDMINMHELGHVASGADDKGMRKHFESRFSEDERTKSEYRKTYGQLFTMMNEGYNDHLTAALLEGSPEIIAPDLRRANDVQEVHGHSKGYEVYREIFGLLAEGGSGRLTPGNFKEVTDAMEDFETFNAFVTARWQGRNVIDEMFAVIQESHRSAADGTMLFVDPAKDVKVYLENLRSTLA